MGFRFRKSISLGKFARINLSKSGVSLSGGVKGARVSVNTKGIVRKSVGIPGTGVYYSDQHKLNSTKVNSKYSNNVSMKKVNMIHISVISVVACAVGFKIIGICIFVLSLLFNIGLNKSK
ncbi:MULTISPECIES: DUF4236 domain-containing protein [Clostridium]|uniref:DUF4236 domain-containing protein n=1 Tax=Clostridium frigoriphilum TaxID=443253 RepID=A0ABU7UU59_9CLOT|nr:DUF4236 domain-containing protein [Clostridium sp. DSM 17811]MBU3098733.1 DUF4236 domain-containing protein [Clostridium sp. DSM 17811]